MANIGTFTKTEQGFVGEIVTLSFQAKNVRMVPESNGTNENAPSHRVYVGRAEIGAAWAKRSTEGRNYLSVKLDDPSFNAPIDIACAGGTSLIGGFIEVFREEFAKIDFPIPIGRIFRSDEAMTAVAKGCLVAAAIGES